MRPIKVTAPVLASVLALAAFTGCEQKVAPEKVEPATKELLADSGLYRLTLTAKAVERIDLQTVEVTRGALGTLIMPYSALIYDLNGQTWAYTSPEPYVYLREAVTVEYIEGDEVFLSEGLEVGTTVVSVAAAELYGTETGIGK